MGQKRVHGFPVNGLSLNVSECVHNLTYYVPIAIKCNVAKDSLCMLEEVSDSFDDACVAINNNAWNGRLWDVCG